MPIKARPYAVGTYHVGGALLAFGAFRHSIILLTGTLWAPVFGRSVENPLDGVFHVQTHGHDILMLFQPYDSKIVRNRTVLVLWIMKQHVFMLPATTDRPFLN